jgi:hypothetical protein
MKAGTQINQAEVASAMFSADGSIVGAGVCRFFRY